MSKLDHTIKETTIRFIRDSTSFIRHSSKKWKPLCYWGCCWGRSSHIFNWLNHLIKPIALCLAHRKENQWHCHLLKNRQTERNTNLDRSVAADRWTASTPIESIVVEIDDTSLFETNHTTGCVKKHLIKRRDQRLERENMSRHTDEHPLLSKRHSLCQQID